jgi:hypothetical protein
MSINRAAILAVPLFGLVAACGQADAPKDGQTVAQLFSIQARAEIAPAAPGTEVAAATRRRGPKERDKIMVGRTAEPVPGSVTTEPCAAPTRGPIERGKEDTGRAAGAATGASGDAPSAERRRGPKERDKWDVGRTAPSATSDPCPAPQVSQAPNTPTPAASGRPRGPKERDKEMTN